MVEHSTENRGVKSSILFVVKTRLAQLVERCPFKSEVAGSIPAPSNDCGRTVIAVDCKSMLLAL
jgi:hypothetical protein